NKPERQDRIRHQQNNARNNAAILTGLSVPVSHHRADFNSRSFNLPGQISVFKTNRPNHAGRSTYINDMGNRKSLMHGLSLDLSSTDANITVGENLLGSSSVTISVGGANKEVNVGSKVTAAEYA